MKNTFLFSFLILFISTCNSIEKNIPEECSTLGTPPFGGTIFIDPDIITPEDPTTFVNLIYNGQKLLEPCLIEELMIGLH